MLQNDWLEWLSVSLPGGLGTRVLGLCSAVEEGRKNTVNGLIGGEPDQPVGVFPLYTKKLKLIRRRIASGRVHASLGVFQ